MKFVILSLVCASAIRLNHQNQVHEEVTEDTCDPDVKSMLQKHAVNNTVAFTGIDVADDYSDMIKNYACGVRKVGLPLLVWSMSEKTHSKMVEDGYPDLYVPKPAGNAAFKKDEVAPFGKQYDKIVASKPKMIKAVIDCGFTALYLDSDLGINQNPLPYLEAHERDFQISTNFPQAEVNTGVLYVRSNPHTRTVMRKWVEQMKKNGDGM